MDSLDQSDPRFRGTDGYGRARRGGLRDCNPSLLREFETQTAAAGTLTGSIAGLCRFCAECRSRKVQYNDDRVDRGYTALWSSPCPARDYPYHRVRRSDCNCWPKWDGQNDAARGYGRDALASTRRGADSWSTAARNR